MQNTCDGNNVFAPTSLTAYLAKKNEKKKLLGTTNGNKLVESGKNDWKIIAEQLSAATGIKRTPFVVFRCFVSRLETRNRLLGWTNVIFQYISNFFSIK